MKKITYLFILFFSLLSVNILAQDNLMILKLTHGDVEIELYPDKAPNHVKRFKELANSGKYDLWPKPEMSNLETLITQNLICHWQEQEVPIYLILNQNLLI